MNGSILPGLGAHLPPLLWAALIWVVLMAPPEAVPELPGIFLPHLDKGVHALLFFVLAVLLAPSAARFRPPRPGVLIAVTGASVWGLCSEIGQHLLTDRSGTVADFFSDLAGAGLAGALLLIRFHRRSLTGDPK